MAVLGSFVAASYFDQSLVHSAPSGATRAYALMIELAGSAGTLTLGGSTMTNVVSPVGFSYNSYYLHVKELINPPSGTQTLAVGGGATARSLALVYVDDTTGNRTPVTTITTENTADPSATVSSQNGDLCLALIGAINNGGTITDIVAGADTTEVVAGPNDATLCGIFRRTATGTSTTLNLDVQSTVAHSWAVVAMALVPGGAPPAPTPVPYFRAVQLGALHV